MKIALLSGGSSVHTIRWANGLESLGHDVHLITQHPLIDTLNPRVIVHELPYRGILGYFTMVSTVRELLQQIKPDIVNAHYASGYATTARLVGYSPWLLSVWGSDVYDFPAKSFLHRWLLIGNLRSATALASTSYCMARETAKTYVHEHVFITHFGIDETIFKPVRKPAVLRDKLVIGTVKTLKAKYGIDTLIEAFAIVWENAGKPESLVLEITGDGPDKENLENLATKLGVSERVTFHGAVNHEDVPKMLHRLDIYVALSRLESFGVAILEASACELPVVVSDADGPVEVVSDQVTGIIVPKESPEKAAIALYLLVKDSEKRSKMGKAGRKHVLSNYTWKHSVSTMLDVYKKTIIIGKRN